MESESPASQNPQTEKMFLGLAFLGFLMVALLLWSTIEDESKRLAALRANEAQKDKQATAMTNLRIQTDRYVNRYENDPEFVRDQARERLGVAQPGEIVIRMDGARNMSAPTPPAPPANKNSPPAGAPSR